jgi:adenosylcobyric acid synthase
MLISPPTLSRHVNDRDRLRTLGKRETPVSANAIAILGTASDVGKSVIAAGLCRILYRSGMRVAPFKAQNMSLNSYVTPDGGEIGWAQAAQAEACGIEPTVDMNPVLLKPVSGLGSQVIVQGRVYRNLEIRQYYAAKKLIWKKIKESYRRLTRQFDFVVIEGAGGAAEINLRDRDLVNFRMAQFAEADVLLVADIERGGVFASLIGTLRLLKSRERRRVKGLIINKFRGDESLLDSGIQFLKRRTGIPVLGVIPYYEGITIPEEDSVALERKRREEKPFTDRTLNIAVIRLPHMANYTDFAALEGEAGVALRYVSEMEDLSRVDVIILPGTKNTLGDLAWLRSKGWDKAISSFARRGGRVIGICGGYQMLGEQIRDRHGIEGEKRCGRGLGLFPATTEIVEPKITERVLVQPLMNGCAGALKAYEIHMGRTETARGIPAAFKIIQRGGEKVSDSDGAVVEGGRVWGTYLHGIFADPAFCASWLEELLRPKGLQRNGRHRKTRNLYDTWAAHLRRHLDMKRIFDLIETKTQKNFS